MSVRLSVCLFRMSSSIKIARDWSKATIGWWFSPFWSSDAASVRFVPYVWGVFLMEKIIKQHSKIVLIGKTWLYGPCLIFKICQCIVTMFTTFFICILSSIGLQSFILSTRQHFWTCYNRYRSSKWYFKARNCQISTGNITLVAGAVMTIKEMHKISF